MNNNPKQMAISYLPLSRSAKNILMAAGVMLAVCCLQAPLYAQDLTKPFIRKLEYYKYANISIFEANADAIKRFKEELTPSISKTAALEQAEQDCPTTDEIKKKIKNKQSVPQNLIDEAPNECDMVRNYYKAMSELTQIGKVFVVTEKFADGSDPVIIGAVSIGVMNPAQSADPEALKAALNSPLSIGVLDAGELRTFKTKVTEQSADPNNPGVVFVKGSIETTQYDNMYEYFKNMIKQNPQDKVNSIRPNQSVAMRLNKEVVTKMIAEDKVDEYMYITEGEPHKVGVDAGKFRDEIVVGIADYFSWRHYESPENANGEPTGLPKYGIEVKAGLEDIGYPSLWSERITANALWGGQKLGAILPTSLWSSKVTPTFADRKMTSGGAGLNGSFDFPFKLIDKSGVFNVSGSFAFNGASNISATNYGPKVNPSDPSPTASRYDYTVGAHGQLNYTFAIGINDPDREAQAYFVRFKIGGAFYMVEQWLNENGVITGGQKPTRTVVGNLLARIEFMATGLSVPFGAYIQFFDGALSGQTWLQVPISEEGFLTGIRLDGKIYAPITRSPYAWETQTVIMPSVRFIFRW